MFADLRAFFFDVGAVAVFETWGAAALVLVLGGGAGALGLLLVPRELARPALRVLAGFPLFFMFAGAVGFLLYLLGGTVRVGLAASVGTAVVALAVTARRARWREVVSPREIMLLVGLMTGSFLLATFGWGETHDGTIRAVLGAWGDGPLHVLNAEAFVRRDGGDLGFGAFAGEVFREPVGYDFVAAMLRRAGLTVGAAFTLPAAALLACLVGWTGHLASLVAGGAGSEVSVSPRVLRKAAAGLAVVLLLSFGGLQWVFMAQRTDAWAPARFFGFHERPWDHADDLGLFWAHHVKIFSSQKHFLLALAFLMLLASALAAVVGDRRRTERGRPWIFLVVLAGATGVLPLFHVHTFLAAVGLWGITAVVVRQKALVWCGVLILLLALPVLGWYASAVSREGFIHWAPGYLARAGIGAWGWFWVINLGLYPFLVFPALRFVSLGHVRWLLVIPAGALFVLGNLVQLQPYLWDNHKLFFLSWVLVLPLVCTTLVRFVTYARTRLQALGRVALGCGVVMSMLLTTVADLPTLFRNRAAYPVYTAADRQEARRLDAALPLSAIVLADTFARHNHPLTLTGRTLVVGYAGWIWPRGYAWAERARLYELLIAGEKETFCRAAGRLGVTYVIDHFMRVWPAPSCSPPMSPRG